MKSHDAVLIATVLLATVLSRGTMARADPPAVCNESAPEVCAREGDAWLHGIDRPQDPSRAAIAYEIACPRGVMHACTELSRMYTLGQGVVANTSRAYRLAQTACGAGIAIACRYVGDALDNGRGTDLAPERAIEAYDTACCGGDRVACASASMVRVEMQHATDQSQTPLYERLCHQGVALACTRRGWIAEQANQGPLAASWYIAGCARGDAIGCNNAGTLFSRWDSHVPYDAERAAEFYREACRRGNDGSCRNAYTVLRLGSPDAHDSDTLHSMAESCRDGTGDDCVRLAQLAWQDTFISRDDTTAATLFESVCDRGNGSACVGWAIANANGAGTAPNNSQARAAAARACASGSEDGCTLAAVLAAHHAGTQTR